MADRGGHAVGRCRKQSLIGTVEDRQAHRGSDSALSRLLAIFRSMPLPDLSPEEYAEVVRLVRSAIDGDRYPLSARVRKLRSILDKLEPPAPKPIPFPPPKPAGTPSLVYAKLRGGRGRR
jgi:hypothetical protein